MIPLKREIEQIAKDKGIDRDIIVDTLEKAMVSAARRKLARYGRTEFLESWRAAGAWTLLAVPQSPN